MPVDAALLKGHDVLCECPRLVRENVMDLAELLVERGGSRLRGRVLLRVVHLQVPVYEVTLPKADHFHARETRRTVTVDGALRSERQVAGLISLVCTGMSCSSAKGQAMRGPCAQPPGSPDQTHLSPASGSMLLVWCDFPLSPSMSGHSSPCSAHGPVGLGTW